MLEEIKKNMPLANIDLDLTNNCVLACDYCFRGKKNPRRLSLETGKAAAEWFIRESGNNKKLSVALFGGEPLMEFELIKQLVPYAQQQAGPRVRWFILLFGKFAEQLGGGVDISEGFDYRCRADRY